MEMSARGGHGPSFEPGRRLRIGISVAVGMASAVVLFVLTNHLAASRLRWRRDYSGTGRFELSPLTRQVLASVTNDIRVTVLFPRDSEVRGYIEGLLREYAELQPRVKARFVDNEVEPVTAMQVRTTYRLGSTDANQVIFDSGAQVARVAESELSAYDANINEMLSGGRKEIRRSGFKGELLFTSVIAGLASTNVPMACFVSGHDEARAESEDRLGGYYRFSMLLSGKGARVSTVRLDGTNDVPVGCQLLVIPGPSQPFLPVEVERVVKFLEGGGRVLLAMDSTKPTQRTGLEEMLQAWGIAAPPMYAADTNNTLGGFSVLSTNFGSHPITLPMTRSEARLFFLAPRVVGTLPADMRPADAPKAVVLATTGPGGMTR